jgi:porin
MTVVLHGETAFGEDVILDAAGLAPANASMLMPKFGAQETALTGLQFDQAINENWSVTFGKFNLLDFFNVLYPQTGRGVDGFMNASVFMPLAASRTLPLSMIGGGILKKQEGQIQSGVLVYDNRNVATISGLDNMFENGANIAGFYRVFTDFGELPGSHLLLGSWSSGDFTTLDPLGWAIIPDVGIVAGEESGSWSLVYVAEQRLWADRCNDNRYIQFTTAWGLADELTNPFHWTGNAFVQGHGLLPGREKDPLGIGWFYSGLSSNFKNLLQPVLPLEDLTGAEVYYNAEITRWFHLTFDLQLVNPAEVANDTAVIFGLRAKIDI